ncbi:vacuolar iron transporter homolog 4 [Oryza glaberrima]|uniref:vacuolar iron transporter homolog 4 n=1 Tax=Oryza glaberrima TaxID=4538 RepID=UPI00224C2C5F|nr:vacuolar iron transporter homolog 4 [Oryza glaberrima]
MAATNGDAELTVAEEAKEEEEATDDGSGGVSSQWLRAAVLGASDGLVSTAALMLGIGAARPADARAVLLSGLAGLVAGACSMAIGEYVSVHVQLDVELADLERRRRRGGPAPAGLGLHAAAAAVSRPGQAAAASALSFAAGAALPLLAAWFVAGAYRVRVVVVVATASLALAAFGAAGARLGRAPGGRAGLRAVVGGLLAMAATYGVMKLFRTHGV